MEATDFAIFWVVLKVVGQAAGNFPPRLATLGYFMVNTPLGGVAICVDSETIKGAHCKEPGTPIMFTCMRAGDLQRGWL
jgi:hypothetical protein